MQGEVGDEERMVLGLGQQLPGFVGLFLLQEHFKEDVGVDEEHHSPLTLRSAISCWSSTEV